MTLRTRYRRRARAATSGTAADEDGLGRAACAFVAIAQLRRASRAASPIELIVIHAISLPPGEFGGDGIVRALHQPPRPAAHPYYARIAGLRVSAHFLIRRDGSSMQFVPLRRPRMACRESRLAAAARAATISRSASSSKAPTTCRSKTPQYSALAGAHARAARALSARGYRRPLRHRARAQDRPRAVFRLGRYRAAPGRPDR